MKKSKLASGLKGRKKSKMLIVLLSLLVVSVFCLVYVVKNSFSADAKLAQLIDTTGLPSASKSTSSSTSSNPALIVCDPSGKSINMTVTVVDSKTKKGLAGVFVSDVASGKRGTWINPFPQKTDSNGKVTLKVPTAICPQKNGKKYFYLFNNVNGLAPFQDEMAKKIGATVVEGEYTKKALSPISYTKKGVYPLVKSEKDLAKIKLNLIIRYNSGASTKSTVKVKTVDKTTGATLPNASVKLTVTGNKCTVVCPTSTYKYEFRTGSNGETVIDLTKSGFVKKILNYSAGKIQKIEFKNGSTGELLGTYTSWSDAVTIKM